MIQEISRLSLIRYKRKSVLLEAVHCPGSMGRVHLRQEQLIRERQKLIRSWNQGESCKCLLSLDIFLLDGS